MGRTTTAGAIVWWIAPDSFELRSAIIRPHELKAGASYESEAMWKTGDAEYSEVFLLERAGERYAVEALERLKDKASELRLAHRSKS